MVQVVAWPHQGFSWSAHGGPTSYQGWAPEPEGRCRNLQQQYNLGTRLGGSSGFSGYGAIWDTNCLAPSGSKPGTMTCRMAKNLGEMGHMEGQGRVGYWGLTSQRDLLGAGLMLVLEGLRNGG